MNPLKKISHWLHAKWLGLFYFIHKKTGKVYQESIREKVAKIEWTSTFSQEGLHMTDEERTSFQAIHLNRPQVQILKKNKNGVVKNPTPGKVSRIEFSTKKELYCYGLNNLLKAFPTKKQ